MPEYYPASMYPFALQFLLFFGSLFYTVFKDRWISTEKQIIGSFAIQAALLSLVPFLANLGGCQGFWAVFCTLVVTGWFAGISQSCLYAENAKLPSRYIGIFLTSQGLAGIFSNVLRFATLELWPNDPFISVSVCYFVCVLFCLMSIPAQLQLKENPFASYYQKNIGLLSTEEALIMRDDRED